MKALKTFLRIFLTIFFVALIFLIVIICTYVLSAPDTTSGSESRQIISGPWTEIADKDGSNENRYKLQFDQGGEFQITYNDKLIAEGWFKLDVKGRKFKLLMLPDKYTEEFAPYVKYKVLAEISYSDLYNFDLENLDRKQEHFEKGKEPQIKFLIKPAEAGGDSVLIECIMKDYTIDLYNSEHDLTKDV